MTVDITRGTAQRAGREGLRVLVVGSGIAGMQTALELRRLDPRGAVTLMSKGALTESNTRYAQGGIAAVVQGVVQADGACPPPDGDTVAAHVADTLAAGAGLADPLAVSVLCHGAADGIQALQDAGVVFDAVPAVEDAGAGRELARGREAAHSAARILHLGGDSTGAGVISALAAAVRRDSGIEVLEETTATRVLVAGAGEPGRRAVGVAALVAGQHREFAADAVVLATGGAGQLFSSTTNPAIATGDGVALAWRAGAVVADLEFFQFHPTSLDVPGNPLISEAVRGEGARLVDADGRAFMADHHPDGDLAPRDVVARSIARHLTLRAGAGTQGGTRTGVVPGTGRPGPDGCVYLDATALGADFLARRFPSLTALTTAHGFDWACEPVPVVPAAHYWMGGVRTDTGGRTSVPGLFAVGEVARTGVHGANRLASNSLLEGVVFGGRCARAVLDGGGVPRFDAEPLDLDSHRAATHAFTRRELQDVMSDHAGVLRTGAGLDLAGKHLASYRIPDDPDTGNLLLCARLLVHAAAQRTTSCGAHYRADDTDRDRAGNPGTRGNVHADRPPPAPSRSYVRATRGAV